MADIRRETREGREVLTFSGDVTVLHAEAVASALRDALSSGAAIEIVADRVTAADVTFLQSICAAHRAAASLGKEITVRGEAQEPLASLLLAAGFLRETGGQGTTRKSCIWLAA